MFKNNKKEIIFKEFSLNAKYLLEMPKPAHNFIPNWFKKDKNFANGNNSVLKAFKDNNSSATYKMCVPLTDTISSGYIISLPATIYVKNIGTEDKYIPYIQWSVDWPVCDSQPDDVLQSYPVPYKHNNILFRWYLDWQIITPPGYSIWVTHPSHRYDLPFTTLNGFVDTDMHPNRLLLPFFIQDGFEGEIKSGTPIAQIIPIKREHWISKKEKYDEDKVKVSFNTAKLDYFRTYKNRYWSKKKYE